MIELTKDIPMVPYSKELSDGGKSGYYEWVCGNCHEKHFSKNTVNYCSQCGQRVDWINDCDANVFDTTCCVFCGQTMPEGYGHICKQCELKFKESFGEI